MGTRLTPFQASFLILLSPKGLIDENKFRTFMALQFSNTETGVFVMRFSESTKSLKRRKLIDVVGNKIKINAEGKKALREHQK